MPMGKNPHHSYWETSILLTMNRPLRKHKLFRIWRHPLVIRIVYNKEILHTAERRPPLAAQAEKSTKQSLFATQNFNFRQTQLNSYFTSVNTKRKKETKNCENVPLGSCRIGVQLINTPSILPASLQLALFPHRSFLSRL